jgi:hypothetical protein
MKEQDSGESGRGRLLSNQRGALFVFRFSGTHGVVSVTGHVLIFFVGDKALQLECLGVMDLLSLGRRAGMAVNKGRVLNRVCGA